MKNSVIKLKQSPADRLYSLVVETIADNATLHETVKALSICVILDHELLVEATRKSLYSTLESLVRTIQSDIEVKNETDLSNKEADAFTRITLIRLQEKERAKERKHVAELNRMEWNKKSKQQADANFAAYEKGLASKMGLNGKPWWKTLAGEARTYIEQEKQSIVLQRRNIAFWERLLRSVPEKSNDAIGNYNTAEEGDLIFTNTIGRR